MKKHKKSKKIKNIKTQKKILKSKNKNIDIKENFRKIIYIRIRN